MGENLRQNIPPQSVTGRSDTAAALSKVHTTSKALGALMLAGAALITVALQLSQCTLYFFFSTLSIFDTFLIIPSMS